jgi:hypothetical protein
LTVFVCLGFASISNATPVQFAGNNNWYELISAPNTTWTQANDLANISIFNGITGHLATITSVEENTFIFAGLGVGNSPIWLGGFQDSSAPEPIGEWQWVTGESWSYSNWAPGEPNNLSGGGEDALAFAFFKADGTWNDAPITYTGYSQGGYVVEYESSPVPEPTTMLLFGVGLAGLFGVARRNK